MENQQKGNPKKLAIWTAAVAVAFLLGFIPQYRQARALRADLGAAQEHIRALEWKIELAELRDVAGMVYVATNQKNYGIARQHSAQLFDRASELIRQAPDASLRSFLEGTLQRRDEVTAGLAKGDGSVQEAVEQIYIQVVEQTKKAAQ